MKNYRLIFISALMLLFTAYLFGQDGGKETFEFNIYSFLMGFISILLLVIGFLTRQSYVEILNRLERFEKSQNEQGKEIVRIQATLGIKPE